MEITSYLLGKKAGGGTQPTGEIEITENGIKNVSNYATANVNVEPDLESKSITITENTTTIVEPTTGKDGLSSVSITTNVSGGTIPKNINDLNNIRKKSLEDYCDYLDNSKSEKVAYLNEPITLYTPSIDFNKYYIIKNSSNKYVINWLKPDNFFIDLKNKRLSSWMLSTGFDQIQFYRQNGEHYVYGLYDKTIGDNGYQREAYYSQGYDTLEEAINAIKSSETTYNHSTKTTIYISALDGIWTNDVNLLPENGEYNVYNLPILSHNETIQVIPSGE